MMTLAKENVTPGGRDLPARHHQAFQAVLDRRDLLYHATFNELRDLAPRLMEYVRANGSGGAYDRNADGGQLSQELRLIEPLAGYQRNWQDDRKVEAARVHLLLRSFLLWSGHQRLFASELTKTELRQGLQAALDQGLTKTNRGWDFPAALLGGFCRQVARENSTSMAKVLRWLLAAEPTKLKEQLAQELEKLLSKDGWQMQRLDGTGANQDQSKKPTETILARAGFGANRVSINTALTRIEKILSDTYRLKQIPAVTPDEVTNLSNIVRRKIGGYNELKYRVKVVELLGVLLERQKPEPAAAIEKALLHIATATERPYQIFTTAALGLLRAKRPGAVAAVAEILDPAPQKSNNKSPKEPFLSRIPDELKAKLKSNALDLLRGWQIDAAEKEQLQRRLLNG